MCVHVRVRVQVLTCRYVESRTAVFLAPGRPEPGPQNSIPYENGPPELLSLGKSSDGPLPEEHLLFGDGPP